MCAVALHRTGDDTGDSEVLNGRAFNIAERRQVLVPAAETDGQRAVIAEEDALERMLVGASRYHRRRGAVVEVVGQFEIFARVVRAIVQLCGKTVPRSAVGYQVRILRRTFSGNFDIHHEQSCLDPSINAFTGERHRIGAGLLNGRRGRGELIIRALCEKCLVVVQLRPDVNDAAGRVVRAIDANDVDGCPGAVFLVLEVELHLA